MDISWVYQQHPPNQPQHKTITQKSAPLVSATSSALLPPQDFCSICPKYKEKATGWIHLCVARTNQTPLQTSPTKQTQIVPCKTMPQTHPGQGPFAIKTSPFLTIIPFKISQIYQIFLKCLFSQGETVIFSTFPSRFRSPFSRTLRFSRTEVSVLSSQGNFCQQSPGQLHGFQTKNPTEFHALGAALNLLY